MGGINRNRSLSCVITRRRIGEPSRRNPSEWGKTGVLITSRSWECDPKHRGLYTDPIRVPDTFDDDYANRAKSVLAWRNRVRIDLSYFDLGLVQPEGGSDTVGHVFGVDASSDGNNWDRKVPFPEDVTKLVLIDKATGENYRFETQEQLARFKYQRYMQRYLRTIQ